jgi:hypothetical protein
MDYGNMGDVMPAMMRAVTRGKDLVGGARAIARSMASMAAMSEVSRAHCEIAAIVAARLGFEPHVCDAASQGFERWDGKGKPKGLRGEAIALTMRLALLAVDVEMGHRLGGVDHARALVRARAGRGLDPGLAERFDARAGEVCAAVEVPSIWAAALAAEPAPRGFRPRRRVAWSAPG